MSTNTPAPQSSHPATPKPPAMKPLTPQAGTPGKPAQAQPGQVNKPGFPPKK